MIQNLNKENFFTESLQTICPKRMDHFCKWIDEYKKENDWDNLFGGGIVKAPKFHDLPFEMQNGIIARYMLEVLDKGKMGYEQAKDEFRKQFMDFFAKTEPYA